MPVLTVDLSNRGAARTAESGGKAVSLHRLIRSGYNVPAGFVVTTTAFHEFLSANRLTSRIRREFGNGGLLPDRAADTAARIQSLILSAEMSDEVLREIEGFARSYPSPFAVRSSATVEDSRTNSWAGQFDSYLNVDPRQLGERVRDCWASLFNARALSYKPDAYRKLGRLAMAVIVQRMVPSDAAGVAFSADPTTSDRRRVVVEVVAGLGDKLVSGTATGSSIVLDKQAGTIRTRFGSPDRADDLLSRAQLRRLAYTVREIEQTFRHPVDVEWAFGRRRLHILQARPITGLKTLHPTGSLPNINDYELTFKVIGLPFIFADMLFEGFRYLDPLFTSDDAGNFRQYFSHAKMDYAAEYGLKWLRRPGSFSHYEAKFTAFFERNAAAIERIATARTLDGAAIERAFRILSRIFTYYSKTDNEFTDLAFSRRDKSSAIRDNLDALAKFKDVARAWINAALLDPAGVFARLCDRIATDFGVSRADVDCYRIAELVKITRGERVPQRTLVSRRLSYMMFLNDGAPQQVTGRRAARHIAAMAAASAPPNASQVRGRVAHMKDRIVEGRVYVINVDYANFADLNNSIGQMKPGSILVAEFTAPELLRACTKARAIVTDIGGLLSHAAIVSRDHDIPCLVGTAHGTRIFRTGDWMSIDFQIGVAQKISK